MAWSEQAALRTQDAALRKRWARGRRDRHSFRPDSFRKDVKGLVFSTFPPKLLLSCPGNSLAESSNMQTKVKFSNRPFGMI